MTLPLVICCLFFGCGPKGRNLDTQPVRGTISVKGKPAVNALVTFHPTVENETTDSASGYSNEAGIYILSSSKGDPEKGALAGDYRVTVTLFESTDKVIKNPMGEEEIHTIHKSILPDRYANPDSTPLSATVVKGDNKIDFDIP